ncbi:unnamed protein product [Cyprideis torosa]|uniref:Uncharacterized protein n=1 Tax=Cyprideis torosa TaxID=163714 RepID=A0A7R8ZUH0_9CRUS|nr:unnamed protein product [Cyprideis torosa]CAG0900628.1 unnamed protein product [Cyprideis torosa]
MDLPMDLSLPKVQPEPEAQRSKKLQTPASTTSSLPTPGTFPLPQAVFPLPPGPFSSFRPPDMAAVVPSFLFDTLTARPRCFTNVCLASSCCRQLWPHMQCSLTSGSFSEQFTVKMFSSCGQVRFEEQYMQHVPQCGGVHYDPQDYQHLPSAFSKPQPFQQPRCSSPVGPVSPSPSFSPLSRSSPAPPAAELSNTFQPVPVLKDTPSDSRRGDHQQNSWFPTLFPAETSRLSCEEKSGISPNVSSKNSRSKCRNSAVTATGKKAVDVSLPKALLEVDTFESRPEAPKRPVNLSGKRQMHATSPPGRKKTGGITKSVKQRAPAHQLSSTARDTKKRKKTCSSRQTAVKPAEKHRSSSEELSAAQKPDVKGPSTTSPMEDGSETAKSTGHPEPTVHDGSLSSVPDSLVDQRSRRLEDQSGFPARTEFWKWVNDATDPSLVPGPPATKKRPPKPPVSSAKWDTPSPEVIERHRILRSMVETLEQDRWMLKVLQGAAASLKKTDPQYEEMTAAVTEYSHTLFSLRDQTHKYRQETVAAALEDTRRRRKERIKMMKKKQASKRRGYS